MSCVWQIVKDVYSRYDVIASLLEEDSPTPPSGGESIAPPTPPPRRGPPPPTTRTPTYEEGAPQQTPPTTTTTTTASSPPQTSRPQRTSSFRLPCMRKQDSQDQPVVSKIATPLQFAQIQALAMAGMLAAMPGVRPGTIPHTGPAPSSSRGAYIDHASALYLCSGYASRKSSAYLMPTPGGTRHRATYPAATGRNLGTLA